MTACVLIYDTILTLSILYSCSFIVLSEDYDVTGDLEVVFGPCDPCMHPLLSTDNSISILNDAILEGDQDFQVIFDSQNTVTESGVQMLMVTIADEGESP